MKAIGISTDCMCDLPSEYFAENGIEVLQFYVYTATGRFWTDSEITTDNIVEYFGAGNAFLRSGVPEAEECRRYFEGLLKRYDHVVHIAASDKIGLSYPNAKTALELLGEDARRVTLVNSGSMSAGLGHMVLRAAALRDTGAAADEIAAACGALSGKLSVSFIVPNADYLCRVGYAGQGLKNLCDLFKLHPVICTTNGRLAIKGFYAGSYENALMRYLRRTLKYRRIDKSRLYITHAGCSGELLARMRKRADRLCGFEQILVTKASAFISGCCGPGTAGVLVVRRRGSTE